MNYTSSEILNAVISNIEDYLQQFAFDDDFLLKLQLVYGDRFDRTAALNLRQAWQERNFSVVPTIRLLSSRELQGANGAYSKTTDTIYLSQEFLLNNRDNTELITSVLLEEIGHRIDTLINITDSLGDEGELFAAEVLNKNLSLDRINSIRNEDDRNLIEIDGQNLEVEQNQTFSNTVLWSQRIGTSLDGSWKFGNLLGVPNEKTFNTKDIFGSSLVKNDVFGIETSFRKFIDIPVPGIDLGIIDANADVSVGLANTRNKNQNANIKAGLKIDAGYNLGGVAWNLPSYINTKFAIQDNKFNFSYNYDRRGAFFDFQSPYAFFKLAGVFETDAAIYFDGKFNIEYLDAWKSFWGWEKKYETKSLSFTEKFNLSTKWSHNFIDFDTRNKTQVVDWITGRKEYQIGGSKSASLDLGQYFGLTLGLPDFSKVDFSPVSSADPNVLKYQLRDSFNLFKFKFDIDQFIAPKLPIPTSFKDGEEYKIFGKTFGYKYDLALFDLNLEPSLDLEYSINLEVRDLAPKIQIENVNGGWKDFNLANLNRSVNDDTYDYFKNALDVNRNGRIDFKTVFDPSIFVDVNAFLKPSLNLTTGLGYYNLELMPFKKFSGYLLDLPDPSIPLPNIPIFDFERTFKFRDVASLLGFSSSSLDRTFSLEISPIAKLLGINDYNGTEAPDYYPGSDIKDNITFKNNSDVGQSSVGRDSIFGGGESYSFTSTIYKDAFGNELLNKNIPNGDVFIFDSDAYSLTNGNIILFAREDSVGKFFEIDFDGISGTNPNVTNGSDTKLRNFERLILADELKASDQGINLTLASLDDFGDTIPKLYLGGVLDKDYYSPNAPLSTRHLTTTQGSDYLGVPAGFNDVPYILGDGDDVIDFYSNGSAATASSDLVVPWPYISGTTPNTSYQNIKWDTPFTWLDDYSGTNFYHDIIDLGDGNNQVKLTTDFRRKIDRYGNYNIFINSVNLGKTNKISGDLSQVSNLDSWLRIVNFGGSVDLDITPSSQGTVSGILSAGGNKINFTGNSKVYNYSPYSNFTFVLESKGLQTKFAIPEIREVEVELQRNQIFYRTPNPNSADTPLILVDNLDPDISGYDITIGSADLAGDSIRKELGSEELYSLMSPSKQTYIVGKTPEGELFSGNRFYQKINLLGRLEEQKGSYRKFILKNDINDGVNNIISLGGLFDEVVFEGVNALTALIGDFDGASTYYQIWGGVGFNKLDLTQIDSLSLKEKFRGGYVHEIVYSDRPDSLGVLSETNYTTSQITGSFLESPFAKYAPSLTYKLNGGDDTIEGSEYTYEFFYSGSGNNTIVNPDFTNNVYGIYDIISIDFTPTSFVLTAKLLQFN